MLASDIRAENEGALHTLPVLVVDCQSTGATPEHGSLMELGWAIGDEAPTSMLVALPEGAVIPSHVRRITGIDIDDLRTAPPPSEAWRALVGAAQRVAHATGASVATTVIHFASFEERFLRALYAAHGREAPFPFDIVCTHAIAQRLFPDLPRRGLRPLAGYLGAPAGHLRRSSEHVRATQRVWQHLAHRLSASGVHSIDELRAFVERMPRASAHAQGWPMPREARADLPDAPGIYRMRRIDGSLLYIGKASSLKRRVASYFTRRRGIAERTLEMLTQARQLDVTRTETALEAALLEHDEIKAHDPPYNVALRADPTRIAFASFDLTSLSPHSDARHVLGPIRDPARIEGIVSLGESLASNVDGAAHALAIPPAWAPDEATYARGVVLFRARHDLVRPSLRELLALGARIEVDADEAEERDEWRPEDVAARIGARLSQAARVLARARFLCVLSEASVSFIEGAARRLLLVSRGEVVARSWQPLDALPPMPQGTLRRAAERRSGLNLARYDRLRVLTTELRSVKDTIIRTGPSAIVRGDALTRLFSRV